MYSTLQETIDFVSKIEIPTERKAVLEPLIDFIQAKINNNKEIRLNFICTHNSRRSHLAQIWAKTMAVYFGIEKVEAYSGGTEATAMFPKIVETLQNQGFTIFKIVEKENPIYGIKISDATQPMIGFSKKYNHEFNPKSDFLAVMTCNSADENCPLVDGAEQKVAVKYQDPKISDGTSEMDETYKERSLQIASEMFFVMQTIKNQNNVSK
ncbi:MAG: protein-tyrosine-phosphatase [Flavobacteriales bacterium]|nr:MAG: protein-tyrosine-phosphatase [Flavobacteriales bacterium]